MLEQQRRRVKPQEPVRATSAVWSVQELWDLVFTVDNYIIFLFTVRLIVLYFYSFAFSLYIWMNKKHAGPDSSSLKLKQTKFSFGFTTVLLLTWPELPWKKKKKWETTAAQPITQQETASQKKSSEQSRMTGLFCQRGVFTGLFPYRRALALIIGDERWMNHNCDRRCTRCEKPVSF